MTAASTFDDLAADVKGRLARMRGLTTDDTARAFLEVASRIVGNAVKANAFAALPPIPLVNAVPEVVEDETPTPLAIELGEPGA